MAKTEKKRLLQKRVEKNLRLIHQLKTIILKLKMKIKKYPMKN